MANNRLNWDNLGADWTLSYNPNIIERPFHGRPIVNSPQTEVTITGVIQPMTLTCVEDYEEILEWFTTRSKLVRCPVFYRAPITYEGFTSFYDPVTESIRWNNSPYRFSGGYYSGVNAIDGYVINPSAPVEWKLDIRPLENGLPFVKPAAKSLIQVGAIPFYVKPKPGNEFNEVYLTVQDSELNSSPTSVFMHLSSPVISGSVGANFIYSSISSNIIG